MRTPSVAEVVSRKADDLATFRAFAHLYLSALGV